MGVGLEGVAWVVVEVAEGGDVEFEGAGDFLGVWVLERGGE